MFSVEAIESHVRSEHGADEKEEEFYYTEVENSDAASAASGEGLVAALSLADHLDMARPAHEDPDRGGVPMVRKSQMLEGVDLFIEFSLPMRRPITTNASPITLPSPAGTRSAAAARPPLAAGSSRCSQRACQIILRRITCP